MTRLPRLRAVWYTAVQLRAPQLLPLSLSLSHAKEKKLNYTKDDSVDPLWMTGYFRWWDSLILWNWGRQIFWDVYISDFMHLYIYIKVGLSLPLYLHKHFLTFYRHQNKMFFANICLYNIFLLNVWYRRNSRLWQQSIVGNSIRPIYYVRSKYLKFEVWNPFTQMLDGRDNVSM